MAVSVNGRVGGGSTAAGLSAVQEAIKAQRFADLAELLDTLELEVRADRLYFILLL